MLKAQRDLHERLTGLFEPYADQLAVDPNDRRPRAAQPDLRRRSARAGPGAALTPDEIADIVLDGVRTRPTSREK